MSELKATIKGCIDGDRRSQEQFYKEFYPKLISVAYRLGPDEDTALDLLQESYIKIFDKLHVLDNHNPAVVYSWCKRILKNTIIDYYRKNKTICVDCLEETLEDKDNNIEVELNYVDMKNIQPHQLNNAIQTLSPQYKLVFEMHVMDGMTHKAISERLGINEGTSKSNLSKAKQNLKKQLETLC